MDEKGYETVRLSRGEKDVLGRILYKLIDDIPLDESSEPERTGSFKECRHPHAFFCLRCDARIAEGERYFVSDEALATYEMENGKLTENREEAWLKTLLCMDCYKGNGEEMIINDYERAQ